MQGRSVIKILHCTLTAVLVLIVGVYCAYQYWFNYHPKDVLVSKQKLSDSIWLYVTKYDEGNATVADFYRFYLDNDEGNADVMEALNKRTPFMEAKTNTYTVTGYGNTVNIRVTGKIYNFTNSDLFYTDGIAIMPVINIIANGMRD